MMQNFHKLTRLNTSVSSGQTTDLASLHLGQTKTTKDETEGYAMASWKTIAAHHKKTSCCPTNSSLSPYGLMKFSCGLPLALISKSSKVSIQHPDVPCYVSNDLFCQNSKMPTMNLETRRFGTRYHPNHLVINLIDNSSEVTS